MSDVHSSRSSLPILSLADDIAERTRDSVLLLGRIMLGWIFVQSGWGKVTNLHGFAAGMPKLGMPEIAGYIGGPLELAGGIAILLGLATRYATIAILIFTVVATFAVHAFWTYPAAQQPQQTIQFLKNLSIMGGLLVLFASGAGRMSVDNLLSRRQRA